jgi:hypothetical protein
MLLPPPLLSVMATNADTVSFGHMATRGEIASVF